MKTLRPLCVALCAAVLLTACMPVQRLPQKLRAQALRTPPQSVDQTTAPAGPSGGPGVPAPLSAASPSGGSGSVIYSNSVKNRLSESQEKLLVNFMNTYYTSLADLKVASPAGLFAPDAGEQVEIEKALWEAVIGIRAMQQTDLSLTGYSFRLTVTSLQKQSNGDINVRVSEDFIQNFKAYPSVNSKGFNVIHTFRLTQVSGGWRIAQHRTFNSLNTLVSSKANESAVKSGKNKLLAESKTAVAKRERQGNDPGDVEYDHAYNRRAAVAYAGEWAYKRNPDWVSYNSAGGNCMNFVSQSIHAGGIPMDPVAPGIWKWYDSAANNGAGAAGRSYSWSSVSYFRSYVRSNEGFGMVARENVPYYTGEIGDIILMGSTSKPNHTVMITRVMQDDSGNTVDYLVASNTADLLDFPVSAYYYTTQMLVKIYGWNEA